MTATFSNKYQSVFSDFQNIFKENSLYSRLPVIRTPTYSNISIIQSDFLFPIDLLTKFRQKLPQLFKLQLLEYSVIRSDFLSEWAKFSLVIQSSCWK